MKRRVVAIGAFLAIAAATSWAQETGLKVGDGTPAYNPRHISGADTGKNTCPV